MQAVLARTGWLKFNGSMLAGNWLVGVNKLKKLKICASENRWKLKFCKHEKRLEIPFISIGGYITMYFKSTLGFIRILWPTLREDQYLKRDPFLLGSKSCFKKLMIL